MTNWLQKRFLTLAKDITSALPDGPILIIAPHPDDETLGCGGITALLKARGQAVRIIIVTDGSGASIPEPRPDLASVRRKESIQAARVLGIEMEDIVFLSYKDGEALQHISQIANDIASQL